MVRVRGYFTKISKYKMTEEIWKVIDFDTRYSISNHGNVVSRACGAERQLRPYLNDHGYYSVTIKRKKYNVHRLVALIFIPTNDTSLHIDHIDGDKLNNMVDNLRWCTQKENNNNPVTRKRISESHKGKELTEKQKEVLRRMQQMKPMLGRKHSEETRAKLRLRRNRISPVVMMDMDGNELRTFDSIIKAEKELGICHSGISNCCQGKYKSAGGFKWKYLKKEK